MNNGSFTLFLSNYISSLLERTRIEKNAIKLGFDWLIYQLALVKNWQPIRLPFFRKPEGNIAKPKTEAEFGVDLSFLLPTKKELYIFVLKDEALTNRNWTKHNFDRDIRMAAAPDLTLQGLKSVNSVKVVLAYNKDEDHNGIELFNRLTSSLGTKIKNNISLSFERWNLSKLVEEVKAHLISPLLLPQHLFALFEYICSQVKHFNYGSIEWENQLIPNWRNFLKLALQDPLDERKLRLIPVILMILYHHRKSIPNSYPGWIDLTEWAMLSIWSCYQRLSNSNRNKKLKKIIVEIWLQLYIAELEHYFSQIRPVLRTEHGFHSSIRGIGVSAINDAYLAYWHLGRLGILTIAPQEFITQKKAKHKEFISNLINRSADWLVSCLRVNPAALRPLIDLNHIELFLTWLILWQAGRQKDIYEWLKKLELYLLIRRIGKIHIPFIESRNRMDLVAQYASTSRRPPEYTDASSYLLLMILEICFSLDEDKRDELIERYYQRVIKGIGDDGKPFTKKQIDLMGWVPPKDWSKRILKESVLDGIAITTNNFQYQDKKPLSQKIADFILEVRKKYPWQMPTDIPLSVFILACLKHRSPLPPEFWRTLIFPTHENK